MNGLPRGWVECKLEQIVSDVTYGYTAMSTFEDVGPRMLRITDIQGNKVNWNDVPFCKITNQNQKKYLLQRGDLVFARTGATVGKSFLISDDPPNAVYASYLIKVRSHIPDTARYLSQFFKSSLYWEQITEFSAGVGQPNVNGSKLKGLVIPLAPLAEQKRIADKLDALLARVDAARARLDLVPAILKRFRQSVLAAATSGELTREWRGGGDAEWKKILFEESCSEITVGHVGKMADAYCRKGIPFLRSQNVRPFRFDPAGLMYIQVEFHKRLQKSKLKPGDVVVVRSGAPGQCCVIPESISEANCADLVIVRPRQELLPDYACIFINSESSQVHVRSEQVGVAQQHFNVGSMKRTPLLLPTIDEQREIVRRVESLFALADRVQAQYDHARVKVDKLTAALLAKAFRGELVPQDPNDEPADKLLERLRAAPAEVEKLGVVELPSKRTTPPGASKPAAPARRGRSKKSDNE